MNKTYDVIVIGGGHNGLTAAITLARKNRKVLLLEKRAVLGGVASGEEFFTGYSTTGLLHDTTAIRDHLINLLDLERYGLKKKPGTKVTILAKDGRYVQLSTDVNATCQSIASISSHDADAYREYIAFIGRIRPFITGLINELPPDLSRLQGNQLWVLAKKAWSLKRLGKKTMLEFLKVAPMSVADFLNEKFETDFIKAGIAGPAIYGSFTGPWSSYTTLNLLMHECTANDPVAGGPQALVSSLEKAAQNAEVEIRTDAPADKIMSDSNRKVTGVRLSNGEELTARMVASSCTPRVTFYDLLQPNQIEYALEHSIVHYRSRGTTAKVNLAVNKSVNFNGVSGVEFARTGNSFDEMERAFDAVKYRQFSDEPILDIHVPTLENPSLAPSGHSVISVLVHYAPHRLEEGWSDRAKNELLDRVVKTLSHYVPDLKSAIIGSEVLSPVDLEQRYGLTQGHIFHGEHAIDQLITRPVPSCARYETPIDGLYLCGSGSHPGGGITCMPGYLGAQMMLKGK